MWELTSFQMNRYFWVETLVFLWNALLKFFEHFTYQFQRNPTSRELFIFSSGFHLLLVSKSMLNVGLWVFSYAFVVPALDGQCWKLWWIQCGSSISGVQCEGLGWGGWLMDTNLEFWRGMEVEFAPKSEVAASQVVLLWYALIDFETWRGAF